jgi:transcriptional regulator with XRE-family HTH domain/AraC-like DNA-binding protein
MSLSAATVYPRLVYKRQDLRPPSRLYHLEPIGIGTPFTESLTSYISRLAEAHCWTTGTLFAKELAPASGKKYLFLKSRKNQSPLSTSFYPATPSLVGGGQIAEDWVDVLAHLTLRSDLRHLTMLRWRNVFVRGASARYNRAWCSACLQEQMAGGTTVYEHLLWMQKHARVCPLHKLSLSTHCPHCDRQLRPLADRSRVGHCSACGQWLGVDKRENTQVSPSEAVTEERVWEAEQIANLIARSPSLQSDPEKESLIAAIWKCVDECAGESIPGFARQFGISHITVSSWRIHNSVPRLDFFLRISRELGVSLFDFLTDKNLFCRGDVKEVTSLIKVKAARTIVRRKPEDLRQALLKMLEVNPPTSLDEAASQLGYMSTYALRKYPDICQLISERYAAYTEPEDIKRPETFNADETVRCALERAKTQESPPSIHSIAIAHGYKSGQALIPRFPDLCREIQKLRRCYEASRTDEILKTLNSALTEEPPPALNDVAVRLGYPGQSGLEKRYPELSEKITAKYRQWKQMQKRALREALESALRESEPQSMRTVAKRTGYSPYYLRQLFPDLYKAISERFKMYKAEKSMLKKREEMQRVRQTAVMLIDRGVYPSAVRIKKEL